MDLSMIKDKVHVFLPYFSYLAGLFNTILELIGSFFGIDIAGGIVPPVSEEDSEITE